MKSAVWSLVIVVVLAVGTAQAASDSAVLRPFMTFEGERASGPKAAAPIVGDTHDFWVWVLRPSPPTPLPPTGRGEPGSEGRGKVPKLPSPV